MNKLFVINKFFHGWSEATVEELMKPLRTELGGTDFKQTRGGVYSISGTTIDAPFGDMQHYGLLVVLRGGYCNKQIYIDDRKGIAFRTFRANGSIEQNWAIGVSF